MKIKKILAPFAGWEQVFLSLCFLGAGISVSAQVLPAGPLPLSRTPGGLGSWSSCVGVPGGIPYRTNIYATIAAGASVSSVQTAINNCPSNSVVYLSAGTYNWSSSLNLKSGVTLRGAGPGQTIINCSVNNAIQMVGYTCMIFYSDATSSTVTRVNWTAGYTQGTNVITLSSTSGLSVGKNIWFDQLNDQDTEAAGSDANVIATGTYSTPAYPGTGQDRYQFQMNKVTAINGNNVTLSEPVYMPNWTNTLSPQAWWESSGTPMVWVGVEDMTINDTDSGGNDTGIWACGLYACWFRNLDFHHYRYSTAIDASLRCEIRHCSISGPEIAGGTDVYGFYPKCGFGNLYVDNIANFSGSAFLIQSCACCVFAYNYTTNCQLRANFNLGPVYLAHGGNPNMLLFEGNWGPAFGMDNTWGSGAYCTALRNRFTGTADSPLAPSGNIEAIDISITNRHMSVIGNVLGTTGYNTIYQETPTNCTDSPRVYWLGGSDNCGGPDDPVVRSTLLRAYNWTSATSTNGGIVLDGYTAGQIPVSLYLSNTNKPSWFGNLAWPPVDPANPAYSMSRTNIPAGYRFVYGVDPAPASGNQSPVAVAGASPLTGVVPLAVAFSSAGSADPEGAALTYSWNFGDGTTSTSANPSHSYTTAGTYTAKLTVSDGTNSTTSSALTITATAAANLPPTASASASPLTGVVPLAVTFSSAGSADPEGTTLTHSWNFGDGTTSTSANPSHTYTTAGTYTAKLTVSDGTNNTTSSVLTITATAAANLPPTASASASPLSGVVPLAVTFSSAGSADPEGAALTYSWNFGDGTTSTSANPGHTYTTAGTYTAKLTVSDGTNSTTSSALTITATAAANLPPTASASASPLSGVVPLAVTFSSAGSADPEGAALTYSWNFGDGTTSTSANPGHTYTTAGTYTAKLTVSDGTNSTTSSALTITATAAANLPPTASASASPLTGVVPLAVTFSSAGSADPEGTTLTYSWNFGDGTTSTSANPGHTYTTAGAYTARLTVSDGTNNTTSSALTITVNAAPVNQPPIAAASATPTSGAAPLNVTFSSTGSADPEGASLVYNWDFGDGTTGSAANPSHSYTNAGNYLVQLSVSDGTNTTTVSNVTVTVTGLVAAFGFEETNGTAVVDAVTGTGDGTITNATRVTGKFGTALSFNGTDSVVAINNLMASAVSSNMTIEAWVKPATAGNNWRPVIGKSYKGSQLSYVIQGATPQGVPSLYIAPASSNLLASAPLPTNTWSHIAATFDGTTVRLYVNGSLSASQAQSGAPTPSNDPLTIGSDGLLESFWNGAIDEVRIYNRALSATEIQTDMNTAVVSQAPLPPPQNLRVVSP